MTNPLSLIEEHPLVTGLIVFIVGGVLLYMITSGGSSGAAAPGVDQSSVAAGMQMQEIQAQLQAHSADVNASQSVAFDTNATNLKLAQIQADASATNNNLIASIDMAKINADQQTSSLVSTLQAQVATANINAGVQTTQINANTVVEQSHTVANAITQQASYQAQTNMAAINAIQSANECHGIGCWF